MYFFKSLRKADSVRRYTIRATDHGWELREEQDSEVVRKAHYQDWHRVERAERSLKNRLDLLRGEGWQEL